MMRRKWSFAIVTAALAAVVGGGLSLASASTDISAPETLTLKSHNVHFTQSGDKPGDVAVERDRLLQKGKQIGVELARCTINFGPLATCEITFSIRGRGEIVVGGRFFAPFVNPVSVLAVIGGTGDFRNARGQVRYETSKNFANATATFHLIP